MGLPQLNVDLRYNVKLPISGHKLEVRPYLVKEEKILLTAMESEKKEDIAVAVKQILSNCTFGFNVDSLPILDVEYLLLKLKMYSSGEIVTIHVRCNNEYDKPVFDPETGEKTKETTKEKCGHITDIDINLEKELVVDTTQIKSPKIELTDTVGIVLRPPMFNLFEEVLVSNTQSEMTFGVLANCLEYVWDGDSILKDFTSEEAQTFLENLNKKQLKLIKEYIESIPKMKVTKDFKCSNCGYEQKLSLENFFDFFTD